jgi:hypothetical protein
MYDQMPVGSYRMSEFDNREIAAAAEFIIEAACNATSLDFSLCPPRKSE